MAEVRHFSPHPANEWRSLDGVLVPPELPLCNPSGGTARSHQLPSLLTSSSAAAQPVLLPALVFPLSSPGGVSTQMLRRTYRVTTGAPGAWPRKASSGEPSCIGAIL